MEPIVMTDQFPDSDPIIMISKRAGVRIHTFISPFTGDDIANATHVIESEHVLVVIDGQFLVPYATQFRAYIDELVKTSGKPIDRVYLSHRHPDHWFGLSTAFKDERIYALPETIDFIAEHGETARKDHLKKIAAALLPTEVVVPKNVAELGEETIDGVRYVFGRVTHTEIDFHLTIQLPDLGVYVVQDLVYSGTHLYLTKDVEHWLDVLKGMLQSDYDLFLAGHGMPADKTELAWNVEYLAAARRAMSGKPKKDVFKPAFTG
jgi:glyoxylase-like metal-dependent hydrolase (beta-lactamase superfamily II)